MTGKMMLRIFICTFSLLAFQPWLLVSTAAQDGIAVHTHQRVHPVLIRNTENRLLTLEIQIPNAVLQLKSICFDLSGGDDIADLASVKMSFQGDKVAFAGHSWTADDSTLRNLIHYDFNDLDLPQGTTTIWLTCQLKPTANLLHKVDASCLQLITTAGDTEITDDTPGVRKRIGYALRRQMDDDVHTYRIPALTTTRKGTLLAVYDMRRQMGRDLQEDIDIGLSRSTDGGQTWAPPQVIMDMGEYGGLPQEQNGCSDPGILVDPKTGKIFCAAVWMWGKPGKHQWTEDGSEPGFEIGKAAQFMMVESTSDGRRWSAPRNMTRELKREEWVLFAPSPQGGITLKDGTLVMPSQGRNEQGTPFSNIMYSKDHGRSWTVSNPAFIGSSECQAVQLKDGSLMLNMRTERGIARFRSVFTTGDLGQTWAPHTTNQIGIIEPGCNGSLLRFDYQDDGESRHVLLFANPQSQQSRVHHTIQVSFDEGRTWPEEYRLLLDVGRGAGYPSLTRIDEEHIGLVYEGSQSHLVFEKFTLDELLHR